MNKVILFLISIFCLYSLKINAQTIDSTEIIPSVPELLEFHDVIYVIWHEAYPNKDIQTLKSKSADITSRLEKLNNAVLPGILQDKKDKWAEGIKNLNQSASNYTVASSGNDDQAMLDAAEDLHSMFENMVRILNPMNKEVNEFHKDLYVIYHKFYPVKDYKSVESLIDGMIEKADAIIKLKIPKRLEPKEELFRKTATELKEKTIALKDALKTNDSVVIDKAVETMHSKYQDLEKIYE